MDLFLFPIWLPQQMGVLSHRKTQWIKHREEVMREIYQLAPKLCALCIYSWPLKDYKR